MFDLPAVSAGYLWGVTLAFLALLLYASSMVAISVVLKGMSSGPGSFIAAVAGVPVGLAVSVAQLATSEGVEMPSAWAVGAFALAGVCSTYLGRWLMFKSIELIGPSSAAGLQSTSPLITALFGWLLLGEQIGVAGFIGMGLGMLGLAAMSVGISRAQQPVEGGAAKRSGFPVHTVLFGLMAAGAYSGSHVFRAMGVREWNQALLGGTIGAAAGALALALASRQQLAGYIREIRANPQPARMYFVVGVFQFAAQALVIASMFYIPASLAALISMCSPLLVMPISYLVLRKREQLSRATVLGIFITLAGVALVILYAPGRSGV